MCLSSWTQTKSGIKPGALKASPLTAAMPTGWSPALPRLRAFPITSAHPRSVLLPPLMLSTLAAAPRRSLSSLVPASRRRGHPRPIAERQSRVHQWRSWRPVGWTRSRVGCASPRRPSRASRRASFHRVPRCSACDTLSQDFLTSCASSQVPNLCGSGVRRSSQRATLG